MYFSLLFGNTVQLCCSFFADDSDVQSGGRNYSDIFRYAEKQNYTVSNNDLLFSQSDYDYHFGDTRSNSQFQKDS